MAKRSKVNVVVLTGPAGCGLSSAEFVFEELGYYVIKNIPSVSAKLICESLIGKKIKNIAFICHSRNAKSIIENLKEITNINLRFILLNAKEEELMKRFTLSRHTHPRSVIESITPVVAIKRDIEDALVLIPEADLYIDTTSLTVKQLRARLYMFLEEVEEDKITSVTFISFGLKSGIPQGIDMFFDVRAIPNPYWVEELKMLTGADKQVIDYMRSFPITEKTIDNIINFLDEFLTEVVDKGRGSYTIGIACSGGQHRSTYVANYLADHYKDKYRTQAIHRDSPQLNGEDE